LKQELFVRSLAPSCYPQLTCSGSPRVQDWRCRPAQHDPRNALPSRLAGRLC
jgi:hypothetical protein